MSATSAAIVSRFGAANGHPVVTQLDASALLHGADSITTGTSTSLSVGLVLSLGPVDAPLVSASAVSECVRTVIAAIEVFPSDTGALGTLVLGRSVPWTGQGTSPCI